MCNLHYRAALAANPNLRMTIQTRDTVRKALPASQAAIIVRTGLCSNTVKRALLWLRANDLAHVGSFIPPIKFGEKFMPVYAAGPGEDAKITKSMRDEHRARSWRDGYYRRKLKKSMRAMPKANGRAATLLMGL